ncbi:hypothetical protein QCN36_gp70 [Arthrobacter phage CastorTray]|uniref:Uncharacterized protein n=2 Tax=Gordonvirus TaxID=1982152 RepID=A0AAE7WDT5_9CAUD|nr:hypothetical protein QCN36_gp70 [Arthrobacter phage CastorTray]YP_010750427.1 hypothetical protein QCN38_gp66 [Arthrobacter phage Trustiboi]QYC55077.1 hypothetical protein SEA_CASTORTRAY_70 [Arthrobacter phage CastorTray]UTN91652.1 hypothetical protein SEA_TRUSTIBOI_66 [Arthrobacter phage Trustiboi]
MKCPKCGRRQSLFAITVDEEFFDFHHPDGALSCEPVPIVLQRKQESV